MEECVQQEKNDDPGEENERKGDQKLEDDKKGMGSSIANESKPTTSETNSINNKKTNKQKNNSADLSKYFKPTNRMVKKWSNNIDFVLLSVLIFADEYLLLLKRIWN